MEWMAIAELIKLLGGVAGAIVAIIGFVGLVMKKPKKWIADIAKEACKPELDEIKAHLAEHEETAECARTTMGDELRNCINVAAAERQQSLSDLNETMKSLREDMNKGFNEGKQTNICALRHSITSIYEEYKAQKKIPSYLKQDLIYLYDRYEAEGGNSYVHEIYEQMKTWETE